MAKFLGKSKDGHFALVDLGECLEQGKIYIEYSDGKRVFDKSYEHYRISESDNSRGPLKNGSCGPDYSNVPVTPGIDSIKNNKGCPNADLDSVDLSDEKSLINLNFNNCSMIKININSCDLSNCSFYGANLQNAIFDKVILTNANLEGANLTGCNLKGSDLRYSNLKGADLTGCNLKGSDLRYSNLKEAILSETTILEGCDLSGLDLSKKKLTGLNLIEAKFNKTNLSEADLTSACLRGANLTRCNMNGANFKGAKLGASKDRFFLDYNNDEFELEELITPFSKHGIILKSYNNISIQIPGKLWTIVNDGDVYQIIKRNDGIFEVIIRGGTGAVLSYSDLINTCFTDADLYAVSLDHVQWYGEVSVDNANLELADLTGANLGSINLVQAQLRGANLDEANLINADLGRAILNPSATGKRASLSKANIQGADFREANLAGANLANAAVALEDKGVPLLQLDYKFIEDLNNCKITEEIREAFKGYSLIDKAYIELVEKDVEWKIHNGEIDDITESSRYITYRIITKKESNDSLNVYGTEIWFQRIEDGYKKPKVETCMETKLSDKKFDPDTICPNKISWGNKGEHNWEDMMTADTPPGPPPCIPTPTKWCPNLK